MKFIYLLGSTKTQRGIKYAVVFKKKRVFTLVGTDEMVQDHPIEILEFWKNRIEFCHQVLFDDIVVNSLIPNGQPELLGILFGCLSFNFHSQFSSSLQMYN